jgi:large subunit ribosomal protein L18
MAISTQDKRNRRSRRAVRVRARITGTAARPRLSVFRSLKHVSAQLIDDVAGRTLAAASDRELGQAKGKPVELAKAVGELLAEKAKKAGVTAAVFDRGSYRYHGRVAAIAAGARAQGLKV